MSVNDIVLCKIKKIEDTHMIVVLKNGIHGIVHISEVSDYYVTSLSNLFKKNEKYYFKIINIINNKKIKLSWKRIKPCFLKNPFEFQLKETAGGFEKLLKNLKKEIKKWSN